jgi:predicted nucleic acid-binding protein
MGSPTFLTDPSVQLVTDASAVINLIATGCAPTIIAAVPNRMLVVDVVPAELATGRARGRKDGDRFQELIAAGLVEIVTLGNLASQYFEELVVGSAVATLDDGEAATIAYAVEHAGTAVLDERKATRMCAARFPTLRVASTVDILLHPEEQRQHGPAMLADAVFNALHDGRMGVFPQHLERVLELIGHERAALCQSLPRAVRRPAPPSAEQKS